MNTLVTSIFLSINPALWAVFFADSDEGGLAILILLLAGPIFFSIMYFRYRNSDKRHSHERETPAQMSNLRAYDNFVQHLTRQRSRTIAGENSKRVEGSLAKNSGR